MAAIFFLVLTVCLLASVPSIRRQMRMNEEMGRLQLEQLAARKEKEAEMEKRLLEQMAVRDEIDKRTLERMRKRDREEAEAREKGFE